jgi:uncharacterized RDD family membrane protein YckC
VTEGEDEQADFAESPVGSPRSLDVADFGRRLGAGVIDFAIVYVVIVNGVEAVIRQQYFASVFILVISTGYFTYCWSQRGQSLGMMPFRIAVVRSDDTRLTVPRAMVRALAWIFSVALVVPAIVSILMVAFGQSKQALHDALTDTFVVRAR